jgi:hypothetical protein
MASGHVPFRVNLNAAPRGKSSSACALSASHGGWRARAVVRPAGAGRPLTVELMHTGLRSRPVHPPELVRWRWEAVGIDYAPAAIEASAKRRGVAGLSYVAGDVTRLPPARGAAAALIDA